MSETSAPVTRRPVRIDSSGPMRYRDDWLESARATGSPGPCSFLAETHMSGRMILAVFVLGVTPAAGQEPTAEADRLSKRLMTIADAVVRHHVDPPTRQQLVLDALRLLRSETKLSRVNLVAQFSDAATKDELRSGLAAALRPVVESNSFRPQSVDAAIVRLLRGLPGGGNMVARSEHLVQKQVAANRYVGTGITLGMRDNVPAMITVIENGPAWQVGGKDGDLIEVIDDESTEGMSLRDVVHKLRGPAGSKVRVRLRQPGDEARDYTITRGVVDFKSTDKPKFYRDRGIVLIRFSRLSAGTVHELRTVAASLSEETRAVILDFTGLFDQDLHLGRLVADALIDGGVIGQSFSIDQLQTHRAGPGALFDDRDLYVAIGNATSGTPEWIAAALQDRRHARLIGQPTLGRGFASGTVEPEDAIVLSFATTELRRGNGVSLATRRLAPPLPPPGARMKGEKLVRQLRSTQVRPDVMVDRVDTESLVRAVSEIQRVSNEAAQ